MESVNQLKIPVVVVMLSLNPVVMPLPLAIVFACTGSRVFIGCECKSNSMKSASLIPAKIRRGRRDRSCSFLYFVVWKNAYVRVCFVPKLASTTVEAAATTTTVASQDSYSSSLHKLLVYASPQSGRQHPIGEVTRTTNGTTCIFIKEVAEKYVLLPSL